MDKSKEIQNTNVKSIIVVPKSVQNRRVSRENEVLDSVISLAPLALEITSVLINKWLSKTKNEVNMTNQKPEVASLNKQSLIFRRRKPKHANREQ